MKDHQQAEWVDGLIDGELRGWRRWAARRHLGRCPHCALRFQQHGRLHRALQDHPTRPDMGQAAEVFWDQVKHSIETTANATDPAGIVDRPRLTFADWLWQRPVLAPAGALASVALLAGAVWIISGLGVNNTPGPVPPAAMTVTGMERTLPHTVASSFDTADGQVSVIWVSGLPWTPDMPTMRSVFGNSDT